MICQVSKDRVITFVNRKFCEVSGYSIDELIGSSKDMILHPEIPDFLLLKMFEILESGRAWNGLVKNLRKDGLFYWEDTEVLPIYDDDNELTGFISAGKSASRKNIQENEELYKKVLQR